MYIRQLNTIAVWVGNARDALRETAQIIESVPEEVEWHGNLEHYKAIQEAERLVFAEVYELRHYASKLELEVAKELATMKANIQGAMNRYADRD